jgi:hypothetical protein
MTRPRVHLGIAGLFVLLTLVITYPLPLRLDRVLIGGDIDAYINPWVDWWTHHVLCTPGQSLYHTDYLFYPDGVSLTFHSFSHANTALSLLLQPVTGQPTAYNVTLMLAYVLSGFGMYLLMDYLTGSTLAGVVSGLVFAFNPYHVFESVHPVLTTVQWMPLATLFLIRWLREREVAWVLLAAVFFLLNALSGWHLMTFFALWLAVFGGYYVIWGRHHTPAKRVQGLAIFGLLAGLLVLPFLWPLLRARLTGAQSPASVALDTGLPVDLLHLALPPWVEAVRWPGYLGLVAVALAAAGAWRGGRWARFWLGSGVLFLLVAVGPHPTVAGRVVPGITLPWSNWVIPLLRHPFRFLLPVMFGLAGAAGYGWRVVAETFRRPRVRALAGLLVCLALLLDYVRWPFPTTDPVVSPFYHQLAQESGDFAIAPLPTGRQRAKYYMYYQTIHGKRMLGGHISRTPPEATRFMEEQALIAALRWKEPLDPAITDISRQMDELAEAGFRYLVLHKERVDPEVVAQRERALGLIPAYEDEVLTAYRTDLEVGRDYALEYPLTPTFGLLAAAVSPEEEIRQGTFVGVEVYWGAVEAPGRALEACIELVDQEGAVAQAETRPLYPDWPSDRWPDDTIVVDRYRVRVDADLPPGPYRVRVGAVDAESGAPMGTPVPVAEVGVRPVARVYAPPRPEYPAGGCFNGVLCLLGYDVGAEDARQTFTFYWRAERTMAHDYVLSTRFVDPETPSVAVWAHDAAPRDWQYPTSWWDAGEVVSETVVGPPDEIPAGEYRLAVVVYEPSTGEALPVTGTTYAQSALDQILLLKTISIP